MEARNTILNFEVYEDNAGGLHLFVLDGDNNVVAARSGYEYHLESLKHDIEGFMGVIKGEKDLEELDFENGNYTGSCFESWEEFGVVLQEVYESVCYANEVNLVADSEGIYLEHAGFAAINALGGCDGEGIE